MRYEYTVTKDDGTAEIMQAMSFKKFKKSLLMKSAFDSRLILFISHVFIL